MLEGPVSSSVSLRGVPPALRSPSQPPARPAAYTDAVPGALRFFAGRAPSPPRVHLSLTWRRRLLPLPETRPGPPLRRGGAPGTELRGQAHRRPCGPRSRSRPAPGASTLPPPGGVAGSHRHPHPLLPLACAPATPALGQTRRRTYPRGQQRAPKPAPFTTPLGLQTVTLATNLSAASRAPAGPGRGVRSLEPPPPGPAPRARPRPRLPGARSHWATS